MTAHEAEQQELNRAVERLGRGTRPGRLLEFIGARYFQRQEDQLNEYSIAIAVFGRSAKNFDATQDAVVRVEAHRLRKKLREMYAAGGAPHGLQISLPAGSYVPKFLPAGESRPAVDAPTPLSRPADRSAVYLVSILGVALAAIAALVLVRRPDTQQPEATPAAAPSIESPANAAGDGLTELHLLAGYSGSEVIDASGVRWTPDRYFTGGGAWPTGGRYVRGTSRQFLFANWRNGQFEYNIPLKPGPYEMRLFFVSPQTVGDEKIGGFEISLNGKPLFTTFDINVNARGADVAEELVVRDVMPGDDGFVRVGFTNQVGIASLNALELVPGTAGKLRPIRISTQPTSFVDHKGQRWRADDYFINGFRSTERRRVAGTEDPELFVSERYGHFGYAIPVDVRGRYTVVLHFAEFYFGDQATGGGGIGSRVFNVYCNGQTLLKNFDIYKEAGSLRLVSRVFRNIEPSPQGKINLTFEPVANNATISGIEILDESGAES
jgi:hypothetical protein